MAKREDMIKDILSSLDRDSAAIKRLWENPIGTPTRHFFVDNLFSREVASRISESFPNENGMWRKRETFRERKRTLAKLSRAPQILTDVTYAIQSPEVLAKISEITGVKELVGDPLLYAGGLSMMMEGDFLNPHIDNSHNMDRTLYRKFNALYYVSPNWESANGGNLELWDEDVTSPVEIVSKYNRLVIMETNKLSWHSVNKVKASGTRCCVSNYYFAKGPQPYAADYYHVTSFMGRPEEKLKRLVSHLDNSARQFVASALKISRGKDEVNTVMK